ncbi:hypothetical protein [Thaumasiovibrio subtropicus]|uniref:hypothetical protein n=1 Tax=Thaumasiovibrio subtropicus TaxID=1891207 RepID=UPI001C849FAF|nr:hypothetical protein [Thaumasiovibrio subtropicus]
MLALKQEVRLLRSDIAQLERLMVELIAKQGTIINLPGRPGKDDSRDNIWGCYIDDLNAGGVFGTGRTEAEAKGKTLAKCKEKGGICFTTRLECSKDDV